MALAIENHVPTTTIKQGSSREPFWFNKIAKQLVNKRRKLYNKYRRSGNELDLKIQNVKKKYQKERRKILITT